MTTLDTTDQIFSTLVLLKGPRRLVITVENVWRLYDSDHMCVEGHRIDNGQFYAATDVPLSHLEKGIHTEH